MAARQRASDDVDGQARGTTEEGGANRRASGSVARPTGVMERQARGVS